MTDRYPFPATLRRPPGVGTWTYLDVPFGVQEAFGTGGRVPVVGTINGAPFRSSLMPNGDATHILVVNKAWRQAAGAAEGDEVAVVMEVDTAPRVVDVPEDFAEALSQNPGASDRFHGMSYSHQSEYVEWIRSAKRVETRARRIGQALTMITEGKRLKR